MAARSHTPNYTTLTDAIGGTPGGGTRRTGCGRARRVGAATSRGPPAARGAGDPLKSLRPGLRGRPWCSHRGIRVHERKPGLLPGRHHGARAGRVEGGLLRLGASAAVGPCGRRRGAHEVRANRARHLAPDLAVAINRTQIDRRFPYSSVPALKSNHPRARLIVATAGQRICVTVLGRNRAALEAADISEIPLALAPLQDRQHARISFTAKSTFSPTSVSGRPPGRSTQLWNCLISYRSPNRSRMLARCWHK